MPRSYSSDSDEYVFLPVRRAANEQDRGRRGGRRSPETVVNNTFLGVPGQGRPRATSAGHAPQPNINIVVPEASRSRSRTRHRHHRSRSSSSSSSSRSRSRHARRPSATRSVREDDLPYELRRELDYARLSRREAEERELQEKVKKMRVEETNKIKQEMEEEKRRKKEERERILREARAEEERNKAEELALKKRILREEQERIAREKEKKKLEEEEFEEKFKKKFREAGPSSPASPSSSLLTGTTGYSEEYIESVLHKKRAEQQHSQPLAIDLKRPTFIKVHRKYLHPDTLDAFHLPWEWDSVRLTSSFLFPLCVVQPVLVTTDRPITSRVTDTDMVDTARRRVHHH